MREKKTAIAATPELAASARSIGGRSLARLLKAVLQGAEIIEVHAGSVTLARCDGRRCAIDVPVLASAVSAGLLIRDGARLLQTGETEAWLRRALAAPDDAFLEQHRDTVVEVRAGPDGPQRVAVNRLESPLSTVARLKERNGAPFLSAEAVAAGERLHADFTRAHLQPRLTMIYAPPLPGGGGGSKGVGDLTDSALAARARVQHAVDAIGPELAGVALDICCFEKGLETVERERQWPVRSAKVMLRAALMALSRHYAPPASGARRRRHAWGADDYRPDLPGAGANAGAGAGAGLRPSDDGPPPRP